MMLRLALCAILTAAAASAAETPREVPALHVPQAMSFMVASLATLPPDLMGPHLSSLAGIGRPPEAIAAGPGAAYWAAQARGRLAAAGAVAQAVLATPQDFERMRREWRLPVEVMDGLAALRKAASDEPGRAGLGSPRAGLVDTLGQVQRELKSMKLPVNAADWNRFFDSAAALASLEPPAVDASLGGDPRAGEAARAAARLSPADPARRAAADPRLLAKSILAAASKEEARLLEERERETSARLRQENEKRLERLQPQTQAAFDAALAGRGVPPSSIKGRKLLGSSDASRATGYRQEWLAWSDGKVYRALIEVAGPKQEPMIAMWKEGAVPGASVLSAPEALRALDDALEAERLAQEREKAAAERLHRERLEKAGAAHVARWLSERGIAPDAVRGRKLVRSYELAGDARFDESFDYDQDWVVWTAGRGWRLRVTKDRSAAADRGPEAPKFQRDSFIEVDLPAEIADAPSYILEKAARRDPARVAQRWEEDRREWARRQARAHLEQALAEKGVTPAMIRGRQLMEDSSAGTGKDVVWDYRQTWVVWTDAAGYRVTLEAGERVAAIAQLDVREGEPFRFRSAGVVEVPLSDALSAAR